MRFSESFIQQVLDANNLVDLISETTQLKPSGGGYMGRCPFPNHPEKSPSFSVSEVKQVYHCFGCKKSGNLTRFMSEYHGMSFPETIEFLANRANIALPAPDRQMSNEEERRAEQRRQVLKANEHAQNYFREQVTSAHGDHAAVMYFEKRGLSMDTQDTFGLGYASSSWEGLAVHLKNRGVSSEVAEAAGLIRKRREGQGHFDLFRERVMFPIRKISGEVVGFGGRILDKGEPKYLNSPETPVFHKGRTLYGMDQTARYIRSEDRVIVVEGYMDLIALFQAGVKNVAATLGTALTLDHAWALKKLTLNITVLFDGDSAGQAAAEKSLPILLQAGLRPRGLTLPDGQDPDDFVKAKGSQAMGQLLDSAPDLFNLCLHHWTLTFRGAATEKLALIEKLQPILNGMQDAMLREMYLKDLAPRIQMNLHDLKKTLSDSQRGERSGATAGLAAGLTVARPNSAVGPGGSAAAGANSQAAANGNPGAQQNQGQQIRFTMKASSKAERVLLSLVLKNRANLEFVQQQGLQELLTTESLRQIFAWIDETSRQSPDRFDKLSGLLTELVDDAGVVFESEKVIGLQKGTASSAGESGPDSSFESGDAIQDRMAYDEFEAELLRDCVRRVRADGLKRQIERLTAELRIQSSADKLEQLMRLQRERMALMKNPMNSIPKDAE
jgi:DNA primase